MRRSLWIILFTCILQQAWTRTLILDDSTKVLKLGEFGGFYEEKERGASIDQITELQFVPYQEGEVFFDKDIDTYWLRYDVDNRFLSTVTYFLSTTSSADYCQVYVVKHGGVFYQTSGGALVDVKRRPYREQLIDPYLPVTFPEGKAELYIGVTSERLLARKHRDINRLVLMGAQIFKEVTFRDTYFDGLLFGACFLLLVISLLLYFLERERLYLQTFLMLLVLSLYPFSALGYLLKYFLYDWPWLETYADYFFGCLSGIAIISGSISYLRLKKYAPFISKMLYGILALQLVLFVSTFFSGLAFKLWLIVTGCGFIPLIAGIYKALKAHYRLAYYYLAGILCLSGMFFIFLFRWFGWIGYKTFMIWFNGQLYVGLFGFFLLLGLIDRFFQVRKAALEKQLESERTIRKAEEEKNLFFETQRKELEQKVEERTKEIAEKNKQLMELDELKSSFFANISHEFRTPITLIQGPIQHHLKLERYVFSKEELESMLRNAKQLLQLINQLLDLAKAEGGKLVMKQEDADLNGLIEGIVNSYIPYAEVHKKKLRLENCEERLFAHVDTEKIRQSISNVIHNALKYTREGTLVTVTVGKSQNKLRLVITDEGPGIPDTLKDKVFERFYTNNDIGEGVGIGLALAREFLQLHHGDIEVKDNVPNGAKFIISLPLATEYVSVTTPYSPPSGKGEVPIILVIEDHEELRTYIKKSLGTVYEIHEASNGEEGVAQACAVIPDLIICDVMMPKKDGFEVTKTLKTRVETSHIPIIMLTARSTIEDKVAGFREGVDDYLIKPFHTDELNARIVALIENRKRLIKAFQQGGLGPSADWKIPDTDQRFLDEINNEIYLHLEDEGFGIEDMSEELKLNRTTLFRKIKALTGKSPSQYIRLIKLKKSVELLETGKYTVSEVSYAVGFNSPAYFTKCFKEEFGRTPSEWK